MIRQREIRGVRIMVENAPPFCQHGQCLRRATHALSLTVAGESYQGGYCEPHAAGRFDGLAERLLDGQAVPEVVTHALR